MQARLLEAAKAALEAGRPARTVAVAEEDARAWRLLQLLTAKPVLYVCNVEEAAAATGNAQSERVAAMAAAEGVGLRGDLGGDRGGDRPARRRRAGASSSSRWGCTRPGSTG